MNLRRIFVVVALALGARGAFAQQFQTWQVLGRFESNFEKGSTTEPTPAEKILPQMLPGKPGPDFAETYKGMGGEQIRWTPLRGELAANALDVGVIDLNVAAPPPASMKDKVDNATCYLYRRIDADSDMQLVVTMGSDDGMRAWFNGELITDVHAPRALNVRDQYVVLRLHAGANHLFVKVTQLGGPCSFQMAPWSKVSSEAVNSAIDRGVEFMLQTQLIDGTWGYCDHFGGGHAAFAAYTLLKCGVKADHPAVRMALEATKHRPMDTTYATSALILALVATGDDGARGRVEEACHQLLDWQDSSGLYGYPRYPDDPNERPVDLSCTLFAALALRAAAHDGVKTPDAVWKKFVSGTLRCLEREHEVEMPGGARTPIAGFSYRIDEGATGSMTTAGLSVLAIAEEQTEGRLPVATRTEIAAVRERGVAWIARNMTWSTNPGARAGHIYYWIYGLERAGALLNRDKFGDVDWYAEGAANLIKAQKDNGSWNSNGVEDDEYQDTLLALLFLRKATTRTTGESTKASKVAETRESDAEVALRATVGSPLTVWVTNLRGAEIDKLAGAPVDVEKIEYFARRAGDDAEPELLGTIAGGSAKPTELQRFALQHRFPRSGVWLLSAHVWLRAPSGLMLKSPELEVQVEGMVDAVRLEYAGDAARDLLIGAAAKFTASTSRGDKQLPANVGDGHFSTRWQCEPNDEFPWIRVALDRTLKADRVVLTHARPRLVAASSARATRVDVIVNGKDHFAADLDPDVMAKTSIALGQVVAIKQLEVRVLATRDRKLGTDPVGFSEIELRRGR